MKLIIENRNLTLEVPKGSVLLDVLRKHGFTPDAPCGGKGICGKCRVIANSEERLACQTKIDRDMTVLLSQYGDAQILTDPHPVSVKPDGENKNCLAFDLGTTTIAAYLMDGLSGETLVCASCMNPQVSYGADVISRIQYALDGGGKELSDCVRLALEELARKAAHQAGISMEEIGAVSIVGNTAMHHLLLEIDPTPLTVPPYMPAVRDALLLPPRKLFAIPGEVRILPNIAGFVGGDTVGCLLAARLEDAQELTLLVDIGTNGEMVLGDSRRRIACSTAAGPAFEGAKITCGTRGVSGAVDRVTLENGRIQFHTIGGKKAVGLCGSGLLDLTAVLLKTGYLDRSGRMIGGTDFRLEGTDVYLTQKDIREVQLAKAAIRAGIEMMCRKMDVQVHDIRRVLLAGAFGNCLDPRSACAIGMIPPVLLERICPVGNAAGEGARIAALNRAEFWRSDTLARETEFLELASLPQFNDCYIDCLSFEEESI